MISKAYLDSNILIAEYFESHTNHKNADKLLLQLNKQRYQICLSPLTFDEFWYGIIFTRRANDENLFHKPYKYFVNELKTATNKLLQLNVEIMKFIDHRVAISHSLKNIKKYNLKPRDAFHLSYCLENKIQVFVTLDSDFQKLKIPEIRVMSYSDL